MGLQEKHNDHLKKSSDAIDKILSTEKGKKWVKDYVNSLQEVRNTRNKAIRALKKQLKTDLDLNTHIDAVVAENQAKIVYCDIHNHGYELITEGEHKGALCEINPTDSFMLLFGYFRKYGKKSMKQFQDEYDFLSESYTINEYTMNCYQGQGCFYRIYKDGKAWFQI